MNETCRHCSTRKESLFGERVKNKESLQSCTPASSKPHFPGAGVSIGLK